MYEKYVFEKFEKIEKRIDFIEDKIDNLEQKLNTLIDIISIFSNKNDNRVKLSSVIIAFLAGGVANMIGIYTLVKTIIELFFNFRR